VALFGVAFAGDSVCDTHYVAVGAAPEFPYTSPDTAARDIQSAMDAAEPGDVVLVLPGIYVEFHEARVTLGVDLMGAGPSDTVLVGDEDRHGGVLHGRIEAWDSRIEGFTLRSVDLVCHGTTVFDSVFENSSVKGDEASVSDCAFFDRDGPYGQRYAGHAIECWGDHLWVERCSFENNAGIHMGDGRTFTVTNSLFANCSSGVWVAAGSVQITNSLFAFNSEGVHIFEDYDAIVHSCTFFGNETAIVYDWDPPSLNNSIIWGTLFSNFHCPADSLLNSGVGPPPVTFSCIEGGYPGRGNIDLDPQFMSTSPIEPCFHLWPTSPCIDAGDGTSEYSNEPQPNGRRINMGAYGNTAMAMTSHLVDSDYDGIRDDWELSHFVNLYQDGRGDADGDGLDDYHEYYWTCDPLHRDTDRDRLLDGDEVLQYGTLPYEFDTDADGVGDGSEIRTGTDPLNPESFFGLADMRVEGDQMRLYWHVWPGLSYQVYTSLDLLHWSPVGDPIMAAHGCIESVYRVAGPATSCFWRMAQVP